MAYVKRTFPRTSNILAVFMIFMAIRFAVPQGQQGSVASGGSGQTGAADDKNGKVDVPKNETIIIHANVLPKAPNDESLFDVIYPPPSRIDPLKIDSPTLEIQDELFPDAFVSGLPIAYPDSLILFTFQLLSTKEFISWVTLYNNGFSIAAFALGGKHINVPLRLVGKKNDTTAQYAVSARSIQNIIEVTPGSIIGIECKVSTSTYTLQNQPLYFENYKWIQLYNSFGGEGIPGLHFSLANSYSVSPSTGSFDANPIMIAWGVKFFPFPVNNPNFYLGASIAGFAAITASASTNSNASANFTQATICPILVDINNVLSFGPSWVYHWDTNSFSFTLLVSVDSGVLKALSK